MSLSQRGFLAIDIPTQFYELEAKIVTEFIWVEAPPSSNQGNIKNVTDSS